MKPYLVFLGAVAVSTALHAGPKPAGFGSSKAPIEINADNLQVFQEENKAIFEGHVVAIQEQVRLKADKMTVYYRSPDESSEQQQDAIKKIDVQGNVFMTTPDETASGLKGTYNVQGEEIRLIGNVVLTRGKNTLKGDSLVYDLKKGKSVMSSGDGAAAEEGNPAKKARVRAVFIPEKNMETKDDAKENSSKPE